MKKLIQFYKSIFWAIIILILSILPASDMKKISFIDIPNLDKIMHGLFYSALCIIIIFDIFYNNKLVRIKKVFILGLFISVLYGIILEFVQLIFTSSRAFEIFDIVADTLGVILGFFIAKYLYYLMVIKNKFKYLNNFLGLSNRLPNP